MTTTRLPRGTRARPVAVGLAALTTVVVVAGVVVRAIALHRAAGAVERYTAGAPISGMSLVNWGGALLAVGFVLLAATLVIGVASFRSRAVVVGLGVVTVGLAAVSVAISMLAGQASAVGSDATYDLFVIGHLIGALTTMVGIAAVGAAVLARRSRR